MHVLHILSSITPLTLGGGQCKLLVLEVALVTGGEHYDRSSSIADVVTSPKATCIRPVYTTRDLCPTHGPQFMGVLFVNPFVDPLFLFSVLNGR